MRTPTRLPEDGPNCLGQIFSERGRQGAIGDQIPPDRPVRKIKCRQQRPVQRRPGASAKQPTAKGDRRPRYGPIQLLEFRRKLALSCLHQVLAAKRDEEARVGTLALGEVDDRQCGVQGGLSRVRGFEGLEEPLLGAADGADPQSGDQFVAGAKAVIDRSRRRTARRGDGVDRCARRALVEKERPGGIEYRLSGMELWTRYTTDFRSEPLFTRYVGSLQPPRLAAHRQGERPWT
jgi:hypothetical protein